VAPDRLPRRTVIVASDIVWLYTQRTMTGLVIAGEAEAWMLAGLAGPTGAGTGFLGPASRHGAGRAVSGRAHHSRKVRARVDPDILPSDRASELGARPIDAAALGALYPGTLRGSWP
jgi:hypothetical protein